MGIKARRSVTGYQVFCDCCGCLIYFAPDRAIAEMGAKRWGKKQGRQWYCRKCAAGMPKEGKCSD